MARRPSELTDRDAKGLGDGHGDRENGLLLAGLVGWPPAIPQDGALLLATLGMRRGKLLGVTLAPEVLDMLRAHRAHQAAERLSWGASYTDSGLVITTEDGRPFQHRRMPDHR